MESAVRETLIASILSLPFFYSTGQSSSLDLVFCSIGLRSLYVDQTTT